MKNAKDFWMRADLNENVSSTSSFAYTYFHSWKSRFDFVFAYSYNIEKYVCVSRKESFNMSNKLSWTSIY